MKQRYTTDEMLQVYARHPLSLESIMKRLGRSNLPPARIEEFDLAVDPEQEVTDQNHIGGAWSTLRLAARAEVSSRDRVVDLGCGIGGPARLISSLYGCTVRGIDANARRIEEARTLAALVGLEGLVSFDCDDFTRKIFHANYSVVWAQNSWIHIDHPRRLAQIAASALVASGRIAFEDVTLKRLPRDRAEATNLEQVSDSWRASFSNAGQWSTALERAGFAIASMEDESAILLRFLERVTGLALTFPDQYPAHEVTGWNCALDLTRGGIFGYTRIVGRLGPA